MGDYYRLGRICLFLTRQILPSRPWTKNELFVPNGHGKHSFPPYFGVAESKASLILPIRESGVELWGGPNERWGVLKNRAMHSARANSGARELTPENALYHAHTPRPRTERPPMADAYGHTTGNTPEPVRFQKLSLVRPS